MAAIAEGKRTLDRLGEVQAQESAKCVGLLLASARPEPVEVNRAPRVAANAPLTKYLNPNFGRIGGAEHSSAREKAENLRRIATGLEVASSKKRRDTLPTLRETQEPAGFAKIFRPAEPFEREAPFLACLH